MTGHGQQDMLATLRAIAAADEERRQKALAELDALAREVDAERLLITLATHLLIDGSLSAKTELLVYHLLPKVGRTSDTAITPWHINRGLGALDALFDAASRHRTLPDPDAPPGHPPSDLDSLLSHLAIEAAVVRGSAYPEQTSREIAEIQGHFDEEFERFTGIKPSRAIALAVAILRTMQDRYATLDPALRDAGRALEEHWKVARRCPQRLGDDERRLLATFKTHRAAFIFGYVEQLAALAPGRLPLSRADVPLDPPPTQAEWAALGALIGCDQPDRARMASPLEMRGRPLLVLPDGRVLLYDVAHALDQLWEAFEREAKAAEPRWFDGPYAQHKGQWLEEQVVAYLRRLFPASATYRRLAYPDPDRVGRTAELDVAIAWPPFLILVEAKAKQFRLAGQLGDTRLLTNDLRANVADAFQQARRARRYIEANEEARFTEIDTGRTLVVRRDALRRTYLTTVSLHALADLTTRLASVRALDLFRDDEYPWALSIADLDIVTGFCPGPDILLHYIERRLAVQAGEVLVLGDELELFGAYLDTRLQATRLWERDGKPVDDVMLSGYQAQFDAAMAWRRGDREEAPDIRLAVPPEIEALLATIRERGSADGRWIAFSLLSLSDGSLRAIAHILRKLRREPIPSGKFRGAAHNEGDCTVAVTATRDLPPDALFDQTIASTMLEKYRRKTTKSIGLGIVLADGTLAYESIFWRDERWSYDPVVEQMLKDQPSPNLVLGAKLPGRNDPCVCGSGKKFKWCCLPKIDAARRL